MADKIKYIQRNSGGRNGSVLACRCFIWHPFSQPSAQRTDFAKVLFYKFQEILQLEFFDKGERDPLPG